MSIRITRAYREENVRYWHIADVRDCLQRRPLSGAKRTISEIRRWMSAFGGKADVCVRNLLRQLLTLSGHATHQGYVF